MKFGIVFDADKDVLAAEWLLVWTIRETSCDLQGSTVGTIIRATIQ